MKNEYDYLNKFLYEQNNNNQKHTFNLPNNKYNKPIIETKIQDNIFLIKSDIWIEEDTFIKTDSNIEGLLLNFVFQGENNYKSLISDYSIKAQNNFTGISLINNEKGIDTFDKNSSLKSISIVVKRDFLEVNLPKNKISETIFRDLENKNCNMILKNKQTNHKTALLANDIYKSNHTGDLEKLFLHSKVLELLYTEFNDLCQNPSLFKSEKIRFSDYDIEALHLAKDILLKNMQNPPSIIELSKIIKLNEFKLKIGFKKLFDITPYRYLHEYKRQKHFY